MNLHTLDASLIASVWICVAKTMELRLIHGVKNVLVHWGEFCHLLCECRVKVLHIQGVLL